MEQADFIKLVARASAAATVLSNGEASLSVGRGPDGLVNRITRVVQADEVTPELAEALRQRVQQRVATGRLNECLYCGMPTARPYGECARCGGPLPLVVPESPAHFVPLSGIPPVDWSDPRHGRWARDGGGSV